MMRALRKIRVSTAVQIVAALVLLGGPAIALGATGGNAATATSVTPTANITTAATAAAAEAHAVPVAYATKARHRVRHHRRSVRLTPAVASWYYDAGSTACGFHAHFGVANKTLPCGTKVAIRYGSRTLTATVDDRGPYVGGRSYDLDQTTAQALGMDGVVTVFVAPRAR